MIEFFCYLLGASLWIWGVYAVFDSKHLLGRIASWIEAKTSTTFCRPLFLCPVCMSSAHGITWGLILFGLSFQIIPFIICLAGLNYIINQLLPE